MSDAADIDVLEQAAEALGLPLVVRSQRGEITMNSQAAALHGGGSVKDFVTVLGRIVGTNGDDDALKKAFEEALKEGHSRLRPHDGSRGDARYSVSFTHRDGFTRAVLMPASTALSLSAQRRATSLDVAASALHEVANALTAIVGWAAMDESKLSPNERLAWISQSAESAWDAARNVLSSVREENEETTLDASAIARQVARLIEPTRASRSVHFDAKIDDGLFVHGMRTGLWSIMWNLTKNAIEAVDVGGHVMLAVTGKANAIEITVEDDGPGLDESARKKALTPYFTTKPEGTGLGLSLVQRAVEDMHGRLDLLPRKARGLIASVSLPRVDAPKHGEIRPSRDESGPREKDVLIDLKVLVVEDDDALRGLVETALSLRGAKVIAVENIVNARQRLREVGLVIADLTLPDGSGHDVIAAARALPNPPKCILMSGHEGSVSRAANAAPDAAMRKPFVVNDLLDLCRAVMRGRAQAITAKGR